MNRADSVILRQTNASTLHREALPMGTRFRSGIVQLGTITKSGSSNAYLTN
jgi:hypothetical protein